MTDEVAPIHNNSKPKIGSFVWLNHPESYWDGIPVKDGAWLILHTIS